MDWSRIPDILAVACLAAAFSSILKRDQTTGHGPWLAGWILIVVHFLFSMPTTLPSSIVAVCSIISTITLIAAGIFFMWATVPYDTGISCRWMVGISFLGMAFYTVLAAVPQISGGFRDDTAIVIGTAPLAIGMLSARRDQHPLRWVTVGLQFALGIMLVVLGHLQNVNPHLGTYAILFSVFMGCCLYFWYTHRSGTAGSIITIGGFFAWAMVFVIAPSLDFLQLRFHLENEVWNLPKYVVAVGMLLLLLEKQIERSQYLALHDDLTRLANRRLFQDRLISAIERARRSGVSMALLQIDLDGFKIVNDTHGHHVGDMLLQYVSAQLSARVRRCDTLARTGGDEFSLILEETSNRTSANQVADSLAQMLRQPFELAGHRIQIGASIGVAIYPEDAQNADNLCIAADFEMYEVKQLHKGVKSQHRNCPEDASKSRNFETIAS
jgi:diguanylate cyclase (GGDEF)-like protein